MEQSRNQKQKNTNNSKVVNLKGRKKKNIRKDKLRLAMSIFLVIIVIMLSIIVVNIIKQPKFVDLYANIFNNVYKSSYIDVNKYIIYGTHFNIEGTSENIYTIDKVKNVKLILKSLDGEKEFTYTIDYGLNDKNFEFLTSDLINKGINLESLPIGRYIVLIDVEHYNEIHRYYTLQNNTEYNEIEYYTITKNEINNKIVIGFDEYTSDSSNEFKYMYIEVEETDLPDEIYDIVIDAGHGGTDSGAVNKEYEEADIVLDYAIKLKEELGKLGLKVYLTRDGTEDVKEKMVYTMYDENGRVNKANSSKAKFSLSLHLNSNSDNISSGGVEVYAPSKSDLTFAKCLADNIVNMAGTSYSNVPEYKKDEGVYVENFTNASIESFRKKAVRGGYEPYNLTTDTPYLYMIRELGGICTNAFVDGRNTSYGANKYINSNIGIEAYLLELGYMNFEDDLNNILENKDLYIQAIVKSVQEEILK